MFSPTSKDLLQKGVNVWNEDVFYNYIDASSMSKSKNGRPFWVGKEVHHVTLQALIKVYYQSRSLVVDLFTSTKNFRFLSFSFLFAFIPIFLKTYMLQAGNNIRVRQIF